jgi:hypothetical protein
MKLTCAFFFSLLLCSCGGGDASTLSTAQFSNQIEIISGSNQLQPGVYISTDSLDFLSAFIAYMGNHAENPNAVQKNSTNDPLSIILN